MGRILVIGAKGMLGRDLSEVLRSSFRSEVIVGWDLDEIDISDEKSTIEKIVSLGPAIIVNLAAYTDVDGCESNERKAFSVNAEGMKHVALGARRCGGKVVFLSTDYVFDGKKGEPYVEEDPPHPLNVYGRSKLKGEEYVEELTEDYLIIRAQWLYGKHGKNFVDSILQQVKKKKVLSIVDDQIGSPTYTVDLSQAISDLLRCDARGVFHVANSAFCSWYVFGRTIVELSGIGKVEILPISSGEIGRPATRPCYSVFDCEKFRRNTGTVLRPWPDALKEYLSQAA
ncbi:MAG: dTDP-4-dehydrorhamnose reductase [Deltaproteobacteria bacterium RBG_13_53_10]|nr:MAG: dTDP-4-dehydrorhamnose reductase [Deltaproteobacteria bacterium RBG_13_53_10]